MQIHEKTIFEAQIDLCVISLSGHSHWKKCETESDVIRLKNVESGRVLLALVALVHPNDMGPAVALKWPLKFE